ncbi:taste receptor type 1 member 1-like [Colossoma macropomum]|uniref:taste receptor type 1 member 1-like n=1 Tax=Colossoma macropomum TaxID=42526 RepID=UPI0018646F84|nr:taste receptor type 1 member 1-like [Colossoma macropomum]
MQCVLLGCLFNFVLYVFTKHDCEASEFNLQGDYKIGGIFKVHTAGDITAQSSPVALECLTQPFLMEGYSMMQVMRFAVEEINNSSTLLPNISLGYEIFDVCAAVQNFPSVLNLISNNGRITVGASRKNITHNVIGVVGPYGSADSVPLAPLFMMDFIPMISYGASSFTLSNKLVYPSFLRTVPTNKDIIGLIIQIIKNFGWNWVAFIGSQDDEYSRNGLELFREYIQDTGICLANLYALEKKSNYEDVLRKIDSLSINVIIVFTLEDYARNVIKTAIKINIKGKVWIAGDTWSMDQELSTTPGIEKIGTVFGVTDRTLSLPGFTDFVYKSRFKGEADECSVGETCNQACENCTSLNTEKVINVNPTYSFTVYTAVYAIAHALHDALNCSDVGCSTVQDIPSYLLLQYVRKSNFTLHNRLIRFDEYGDPPASFAVVHWRPKRDPFFLMVGTYDTYPTVRFTLNNNLVSWYDNGTVPFSNCSVECESGFARVQNSVHKCCFQCEKCPANTYINTSVDFYTCTSCQEGEWSDEGSTYCTKRSIVYLQYTDLLSILFLLCAASFMVVSITVTILFAFNYNTPVVKSAGGSMCFLMLVCLILSNIGVFFYFGVPLPVNCVLRNIFFIFFFTVCLSCMAVRSFQIVSVFKMAAKFPKAYSWWMKYNGQWLCLAVYTFLHLIACWIWLHFGRPKPYNDNTSFKDQTILSCDIGTVVTSILAWSFLWVLSVVCFCFSYMGKDLPKNYNEAKSITFSLVLFYLGWIAYFTAYIVFRGQYVQLLNAVAQLTSSYGIIISFFIPRTYIIVFQPNKNTQAYFQTKIQTYTQTISRM